MISSGVVNVDEECSCRTDVRWLSSRGRQRLIERATGRSFELEDLPHHGQLQIVRRARRGLLALASNNSVKSTVPAAKASSAGDAFSSAAARYGLQVTRRGEVSPARRSTPSDLLCDCWST